MEVTFDCELLALLLLLKVGCKLVFKVLGVEIEGGSCTWSKWNWWTEC